MRHNRSEFDAHAGMKSASAARVVRRAVKPRRSLPVVRVLKIAAAVVAVVIIATHVAPYALAVLS